MNQKVIEEDFWGLFSSRGILVFERLGLQGIQRVTKLAKIRKIVQNLGQKFDDADAVDLIGSIDELRHVVVGDTSFVKFGAKNSGCFTLTVQHWSEDICDEIQARQLSTPFLVSYTSLPRFYKCRTDL